LLKLARAADDLPVTEAYPAGSAAIRKQVLKQYISQTIH
jgi:hypothetical protein